MFKTKKEIMELKTRVDAVELRVDTHEKIAMAVGGVAVIEYVAVPIVKAGVTALCNKITGSGKKKGGKKTKISAEVVQQDDDLDEELEEEQE